MVLQDSIFENLTYKQWDKALRAKVQTTQNLHNQLPSNLDFFILLSSLAGIVGSVSQSNYAAGNTFQDAFAAYRQSIGQRATSLDLGYMTDVGIVAETRKYASRAQQIADFGSIGIRESEFHALIEVYCDTALHSDEHSPGLAARNGYQLLVGLTTPGQLIANGIHPPEWLEERNLFDTLRGQQDLGLVYN
ncbi:KR domain-containing protein [Aspergillus stella-maris]|uniref:KR domain-containing protein n=1 Tax=Aspergillus stella-maris TaxID=1810926 RepID=UPI003CCCB08E